jgi:hypothetical protein
MENARMLMKSKATEPENLMSTNRIKGKGVWSSLTGRASLLVSTSFAVLCAVSLMAAEPEAVPLSKIGAKAVKEINAEVMKLPLGEEGHPAGGDLGAAQP